MLLEVAKVKTEASMRRKFQNLMAKADKAEKQIVRADDFSKDSLFILYPSANESCNITELKPFFTK